MKTLKRPDKGTHVSEWQEFLLAQGFRPGKVDGDFGGKTEAATKRFQESAGLKSDGIVGRRTLAVAIELGFSPTADEDIDTDKVKDYSVLVSLPSNMNPRLSAAGQRTMLNTFGIPCRKTRDCKPITNQRLRRLLLTENVGPFRVRGLRPAVEAVGRVFKVVKREFPVLHEQLGTAGMLCCRKVRGGRNFSNHSWGTAIDIKINGQLDAVRDNRCQLGLKLMAPFFNEEMFFWGAAFGREDAMHFEASNQLINKWRAEGII